jgi:hypothetical protein
MATIDKLGERLLTVLTARSFGYALVLGFWVSLASTLITMVMLGRLAGFDHLVPKVVHGEVLLAEFFLLFVVVATISIRMSSNEDLAKEREKQVANREAAIVDRETKLSAREQDVNRREKLDLLSVFREKLAGVWEVEFRSTAFNEKGDVVDQRGHSYARFLVDEQTKKLRLLVNVKETDFTESDDVMIEAISIWPVMNPTHLDYFHDLRLTMEDGNIVRGPIFAHLDIDFEDGEPNRLVGTWYDLDGAFARARRNLWVEQQKPAKGELSLRGRITFRRIDLRVVGRQARSSADIESKIGLEA